MNNKAEKRQEKVKSKILNKKGSKSSLDDVDYTRSVSDFLRVDQGKKHWSKIERDDVDDIDLKAELELDYKSSDLAKEMSESDYLKYKIDRKSQSFRTDDEAFDLYWKNAEKTLSHRAGMKKALERKRNEKDEKNF